jgi:hypothetical protein
MISPKFTIYQPPMLKLYNPASKGSTFNKQINGCLKKSSSVLLQFQKVAASNTHISVEASSYG